MIYTTALLGIYLQPQATQSYLAFEHVHLQTDAQRDFDGRPCHLALLRSFP